jgi:hypothetical protein
MTVQPVFQAAPARQRQIFFHRQRIDVADAAAFEIAGAGMMNGMAAAPEIVGRAGQDAERAADPVIDRFVAEERAVAAIVLNHEQPHQEAGGRHRQQQRQPPEAVTVGQPHCHPERDQGACADADFENAAPGARLAIAQQPLGPGARVGWPGDSRRRFILLQADVLCV